MADRHYNRQSVGSTEFVGPGRKIVLIVPSETGTATALWVASHQAFRLDNFDCWTNNYFRNESKHKASTLIRQAVAATVAIWHQIPPDGLHSFVDPRKVAGVKRRGKLIHGFCFDRAGFELHPERTKVNKLLRWVLSREALLKIKPQLPILELPASRPEQLELPGFMLVA